MEVSGYTRLAGFLANPAKHSISPKMHNAAFQALGIDACYLAFEVETDELAAAIQSFRTFNLLGANVSMPFKKEACQYMDELTPAARLIGAMNTIIPRENRLIGDNTDGKGFMASLKELNVDVLGKTITILGNGGAALAILCQAALDGVKKINLAVRHPQEKKALQEKIIEVKAQTAVVIKLLDIHDVVAMNNALAESTLLVNGTSVGMAGGPSGSPLASAVVIPNHVFVYDIIYHPRKTALMLAAEKNGCLTSNGLPMLLYQGAVAFEAWTGQKMPVAEIRAIVENS